VDDGVDLASTVSLTDANGKKEQDEELLVDHCHS
jgi:hypothetical protein